MYYIIYKCIKHICEHIKDMYLCVYTYIYELTHIHRWELDFSLSGKLSKGER